MKMNYKDALFSPDISWDLLTQGVKIPLKLYKYQSFVDKDGTENPYWAGNMNGQFHMSLGCEFEDTNDCKPFFDRSFILIYMNYFLESFGVNAGFRNEFVTQMKEALTEEYFMHIMANYQKDIRIGCFTDRSDNEKMWCKYACQKKGYCIEYDTKKSKLFQLATLPILYSDRPYDSSLTLANLLILEMNKMEKKYSESESIEIFKSVYEKILKTAYIPVFIKQKEVWEFEQEYRSFLLKNRSTRDEILKMEELLDENFNIDLSDAISAIYLGTHFDENENHAVLLDKVTSICENKGISLFRKTLSDGKIIDVKIM